MPLNRMHSFLLQAKIGRWDGSEASLARLRGKNTSIFKEAAEIRVTIWTLFQLVDVFR